MRSVNPCYYNHSLSSTTTPPPMYPPYVREEEGSRREGGRGSGREVAAVAAAAAGDAAATSSSAAAGATEEEAEAGGEAATARCTPQGLATATVSTGGARAALARSLVGVLPLATGLSWCANYRRGHQSGCSCWSPAAGGMLPGVLPLPTSAKGRRAALARPSVGVLPLVAGRGWCAEQRTTSRGAPASGLAAPTASSFCVTWRPLSPVEAG